MMSKITQALGHMIDPLISYYLRWTAKVVFIFVGLCVCLYVSNITEKTRERSSMKFSGQVELGTRNDLEYIRDVLFNPLNTGIFFNIFVEMLATLRENAWTDFHEIFSKDCTWDKEQFVIFLGCCN